ncbi:hypothetical protein H257_18278 [Aphanomyces astaci]|uniref:Pentacotripeptide-repeat region of PRORP domain-containing protein n=2 Tax=Aphanomyces astaci TaxID=112090 RepID=W4FBP7_APHAT|nr:hypothetical protein H257_18278 [Aphanomyces astaci]ETV64912.1 hypothetical protein H257_18278 [Aphanomyces astaci]RQM27285.1 hypothetical protein B5M09_007908 [Aphanomyces astaci]|eukprot:XP_009845610.1 hypothetical protein H257_18278 [Aphanomyces astaci]
MLHRSARGLRTGSAVAWTRGMSSVQVNNDVRSLGAIERAVSEATAVLRKQLHDAEVENAQLRLALTKATRMLPSEQPPPSLAQGKPLVIPAIHVPSPPLHDVKKQQPPLVHAAPTTTADDVEKAAPTEAKMKSDLYGGSTPVQFYFRLIECTRKYMLSPKLRKTLATMPLLQMSWTAKEAPAILTALILMDRHHDAKTFASRYASDAALQHRFMAQASRLRCPDVAISILANVAEHHSNEAIDAYLYTGAISACSNGPVEFVPTAFDLFEDMAHSAHVDPTPLTYSAVLTACSRLDKWDYATRVLRTIETLPDRADVMASVIQSVGLANHHEFAFRFFKFALDAKLPLPERAIRVALSSCAKVSNRDSAVHRLDAFLHSLPTDESYSPKLYNALISAYANLEPATSFQVYAAMHKRGLDPDIFTYNSVLLACVRARDIPRGLALFRAMPVAFDLVTICTMLQLCRQVSPHTNDMAQLATELYYDGLNAFGPSNTLYEEYLETLVEHGNMDAAVQLYAKNRRLPGFTRTSKLLNLLLRATKHDVAAAQRIFNEFANRNNVVSSVSWNHLLAAYVAAQDLGVAEQVLAKMEQLQVTTVYSYQVLMAAYFDSNEFAHCGRIFDQFQGLRFQRLHSKPHKVPQTGLLILASKSRYALKDFDGVVAMAPAFNAPRLSQLTDGCKKELVRLAILASEQLDDWQTCVQLYGEMARAGVSDVRSYEATVRAVAKAGEFEAALDVNGGDWYRNDRHDKHSNGWFSSQDD